MIKKMMEYCKYGRRLLNDKYFLEGRSKSIIERKKTASRTEIINFLLSVLNRETIYLEIGVRNPNHNFNLINANYKYGIDPGIEFSDNPVNFKMTSNDFFQKLNNNEIFSSEIKFDIIFIDGLHLAEQVDKDIANSLNYIKDDGFIVIHDCNPPTPWHAREEYRYIFTPAEGNWNGTTWKAFIKWRSTKNINSCCVDTDWGVGILSKKQPIGNYSNQVNIFFEYNTFDKNRKESLNLITFNHLRLLLKNG